MTIDDDCNPNHYACFENSDENKDNDGDDN